MFDGAPDRMNLGTGARSLLSEQAVWTL